MSASAVNVLTLHQLALDLTAYGERLTAMLMHMTRHFPRFTEYQQLYQQSSRVQEALCNFYATIIGCCTEAVRTVQRSRKYGVRPNLSATPADEHW